MIARRPISGHCAECTGRRVRLLWLSDFCKHLTISSALTLTKLEGDTRYATCQCCKFYHQFSSMTPIECAKGNTSIREMSHLRICRLCAPIQFHRSSSNSQVSRSLAKKHPSGSLKVSFRRCVPLYLSLYEGNHIEQDE
jgi:hypothetical protein